LHQADVCATIGCTSTREDPRAEAQERHRLRRCRCSRRSDSALAGPVGAIVHLAGRTLEALQRVAAEITEAGGTAHAAEVDALDEQAVSHHVQAVVAGAGALDISVNAIGVPHVQGPPLAELSLAEFELPLHSYLRSNFITAKNAAEVMRRPGKGL
jgi:NAD(P)-dependent dehydrogenase (short-subunit alcohol dehydrogenase family)